MGDQYPYPTSGTDGRTVLIPRWALDDEAAARHALTAGALSLESAIRAQTSLPARIMGLADRGEIREGYWADLVVFDLDSIADQATFTQPHQHSTGIDQRAGQRRDGAGGAVQDRRGVTPDG